MKTCRISSYASMAALAALLPLGLTSSRAASNLSSLNADGAVLQQANPRPMAWEEVKKHKLRQAFWLMEQADKDYKGHRAVAMKEVRKAGELIGMDLHGDGYGGKPQAKSDARLREAKVLLEEVVEATGGAAEHEHIRTAIKELDKALTVR